MPEWWTYTLSDFLMFSPRAYYRLIERYNLALWPGQLAALAAAAALPLLLRTPRLRRHALPGLLALAWLWVAWAFLWQRYADINWAARGFAAAFALQGVLLGVAAGVPATGGGSAPRRPAAGIGILLLGLGIYPLLAPLQGHGWARAELFGLLPEPTAIGTLGAVGLSDLPRRGVLLVIPALWCVVGGLTLLAMRSPEAWACGAALLLAAAATGSPAGGPPRLAHPPPAR